jgi:hypothetical protein
VTAWQASGTVLTACNCDYGCPCNFNARPTQGHCEGGWSWHVGTGLYGEVRLDGLNLTVYADWPGAIHDGDGKAIAFYDERADDDQRRALLTLLAGDAGGPWGIFRATYDFVRAPAPAAYELELSGERSRLLIGEAVELETEPIRNPVTGAEAHPRIVLPEGLVAKELDVLSSRRFRVDDALAYDHTGRYAMVAPFEYRGG